MLDAVVVGSGPNGLAAGITLARAGLRTRIFEGASTIGGGTRTAELTLPGFKHDVCSAVHPLGIGSPFFRRLPLEKHGLRWLTPEIHLAHPLDDGTTGTLRTSLAETGEGLGRDGAAYQRLMGPLVSRWDAILGETLAPIFHLPRHPLALGMFGAPALAPATWLASALFRTERTRALFIGMAAHAMVRLDRPLTSSFALVLAGAAHTAGWPVARGGSAAIAAALAAHFRELGGEIEVARPVRSLDDLPPSRVQLLDIGPQQLARLAKGRVGARALGPYRRFEHGPGVFKIDYALSGPIPWTAAECRLAPTVHLGGTAKQIAAAEAEVVRGGHPERPYILVVQPSVIDETRAPAGQHVLWAYCHVPNGSAVDMAQRIEAQIERAAPGFRDLILARSSRDNTDLERENPNYVGGDISGGSSAGLRTIFRPRLTPWPYRTPLPGVYLCSASTPPGGGVHGMCGHQAAKDALRHDFGRRP